MQRKGLKDLNTLKKRVHQIMSRNLVTVTTDETIRAAADKMLRERVSCLPVVDDQESVVGIVTVRDFVAWAVGYTGETELHTSEPERDEGILVIIDGNRCYQPDAKIAAQIRKAEKLFDETHGPGSAQAQRLE